jgi:hypothetical protein
MVLPPLQRHLHHSQVSAACHSNLQRKPDARGDRMTWDRAALKKEVREILRTHSFYQVGDGENADVWKCSVCGAMMEWDGLFVSYYKEHPATEHWFDLDNVTPRKACNQLVMEAALR